MAYSIQHDCISLIHNYLHQQKIHVFWSKSQLINKILLNMVLFSFLISAHDILLLNTTAHVYPPWWIMQRMGKKSRLVYLAVLYTTFLSEMDFILFHFPAQNVHFLVIANLIGLLHLLLHDESSSYKHNVTLLYLTHIWNHFLPSLVLSLQFHGVAGFLFCPLLSSYRTCCALMPASSDLQCNLCRHCLFCYVSEIDNVEQ